MLGGDQNVDGFDVMYGGPGDDEITAGISYGYKTAGLN